jgi:hypothetical protein
MSVPGSDDGFILGVSMGASRIGCTDQYEPQLSERSTLFAQELSRLLAPRRWVAKIRSLNMKFPMS